MKSKLLLEYIPDRRVDKVESIRTDGDDDKTLWKLVRVPSFGKLK